VSLDDWIKGNVITVGPGIRVQQMAIVSTVYEKTKAEWLAHLLNIHVMETEWAYYQFLCLPDPSFSERYNVVCVNPRAEEGDRIVGFALPAQEQPILQQYFGDNVTPE